MQRKLIQKINFIVKPCCDKFPKVEPPPDPIDPKVGTSLETADPKTVVGATDDPPNSDGDPPKTGEEGAARAPKTGALPNAGEPPNAAGAPNPDLTGVVCPTPNP